MAGERRAVVVLNGRLEAVVDTREDKIMEKTGFMMFDGVELDTAFIVLMKQMIDAGAAGVHFKINWLRPKNAVIWGGKCSYPLRNLLPS